MKARRRYVWVAFFLAWSVAAFAARLLAQADGTPSTLPAPPPAVLDEEEEFSLSVEVQVVTVPVTVTDRKGKFVTDLDKRDFAIVDNNQVQKIENFDLSSEPVSLAVVVETAGRIQPLMKDVRGSGILITQLIMGEQGEAVVLGFDREVKILQEFTQDHDKVEAAIKGIQPGPDQTHMSDAVARAMFLLQRRPQNRRKVIIIVSEGRDMGSKNKFGAVLRGAQQLGISVYTIGLSTAKALFGTPAGQNVPSSPYPPGVVWRPTPGGTLPTPDAQSGVAPMQINGLELISDLVVAAKNLIRGNPLDYFASGTGGEQFSTDSREKIEKALSRIGEELRNQYVLTYHPSDTSSYGFHTIKVALSRPELDARFRPGYVLAPQVRKSSAPAATQIPVAQ